MAFLNSNPNSLYTKDLENFSAFKNFKKSIIPKSEILPTESELQENTESDKSPEEALEYPFQKLKTDLSKDLLKTIKNCSPAFFEKLVVDFAHKNGIWRI